MDSTGLGTYVGGGVVLEPVGRDGLQVVVDGRPRVVVSRDEVSAAFRSRSTHELRVEFVAEPALPPSAGEMLRQWLVRGDFAGCWSREQLRLLTPFASLLVGDVELLTLGSSAER